LQRVEEDEEREEEKNGTSGKVIGCVFPKKLCVNFVYSSISKIS
jgi:hypothetical protein